MPLSQSTKLVILIGAALAVAGVIAGALPIESGPMSLSDCGSVFSPANAYLEGPECAGARSGRALFVWGPIGIGAVLAFGAVLIDPAFGKPKAKPAEK
ncbi:hypothetical protein ACFWTE_03215 [Nocardiopsis sp. NPDC058631]|uniref:hypothetical protein n=1 Tax=Nocardiopsis sp. NPDC058631 TaxID=3346566 RepID=UPI00365ECC00